MDELRRHAAPFVDRWQRLARGQRIAMVAVLIASAVGFCFLLSHSAENWQPIADGREFSTSDLGAIQSAWRQAGLKSFRRDARKLLVPATDIDRYTAALPKSQRDDSDSRDDRGPSIAKANLFTSHEQLEQIKDNELRATLRRHLKAIPAIADADVIWSRSKARSAFANRSKVTATIIVLPRDGSELTRELAQSLRTAVAGMIPDLSSDDIVVLNQSTGLTIAAGSEQLIVTQNDHREHERLARQLETRIAAALSHIPNVIVQAKLHQTPPATTRHTVARPTFSSAIAWTSEAPDNVIDFSPFTIGGSGTSSIPTLRDSTPSTAWQVAVQVPQASLDARVAQQLLSAEHRTTNVIDLCDAECVRLRSLVQTLLPSDATLAELSIVPNAATTASAPAPIAFTAWPHTVCGFLALMCLTLATRRQRANNVAPPIDRSMIRTVPNAESHESLPLETHHEQNIAVVVAPPAPEAPLTDLTRLLQLDPQPLADALRNERPQAIAVLLTRFPTRLASACLSQFPASLQTDVIRRLKSLGEVPEELVSEIAATVCHNIAETATYEPTNRIAHLLPETPTQRAFA